MTDETGTLVTASTENVVNEAAVVTEECTLGEDTTSATRGLGNNGGDGTVVVCTPPNYGP